MQLKSHQILAHTAVRLFLKSQPSASVRVKFQVFGFMVQGVRVRVRVGARVGARARAKDTRKGAHREGLARVLVRVSKEH